MRATLALLDRLGRLNRALGMAGLLLASLLIGVMTVVVITGVFFRYVLNDSITWIEDVSLIMMVSTAFLVAPHAYRSGANVAIEAVVQRFPALLLRLTRLVINVLILWVLYRYFFESLTLVERGWGIRVNSVPLPWAVPYLLVPAAFAGMLLVGFELLLRDLWALTFRSAAADLPHHIEPVE